MDDAASHTLTGLLQDLQAALVQHKATVATAESCTGGLVATLLTELAGSSAVFTGGVSAYANEVKIGLLGVAPALIAAQGAVSPEVAIAMAEGVRQRLSTTYGLSLTGVAGPGGGTAAKPVGTVYFGMAGPDGSSAERLNLAGDRAAVRRQSAETALRRLFIKLTTSLD